MAPKADNNAEIREFYEALQLIVHTISFGAICSSILPEHWKVQNFVSNAP